MDEYISKEATVKAFCEKCKGYYDGHCVHMGECDIDVIQTAPAADVQLVKRGKWKQIAPQSAICSECGGALKSNGIDKTGKAYIFNAVYKYCPYCGARMDGNAE
jgi:hypothetical protein